MVAKKTRNEFWIIKGADSIVQQVLKGTVHILFLQ